MRTTMIALLASVGALAATGAAKAADIYTTSEYTNPDLVQQVRLVCDDTGRCYRTHNGARVIIRDRDSYNYMPRDRYYERRTYRDYDRPRAGVDIHAPGVSVGVGEDRY
ncbi:hypothetical protein Q3C01_40930 [Bradyrhizobium sp. UFLA05-109]